MRSVGFGAMLSVGMMTLAGSASAAADKETSCGHQASVVEAVRQARLERVKERNVRKHVTEAATWPADFNTAIPLITPWVYEMRMRDVRSKDLAAAWKELCLQQ